MKVDKIEFKRVVNEASHLQFNYNQLFIKEDDININEDEIEYLIKNQIHHRVLKESKRSLFGDKITISKETEKDYLLLKKYTNYFRESSH
ncbi:hypothetical protein [Enterococcus olivae]